MLPGWYWVQGAILGVMLSMGMDSPLYLRQPHALIPARPHGEQSLDTSE